MIYIAIKKNYDIDDGQAKNNKDINYQYKNTNVDDGTTYKKEDLLPSKAETDTKLKYYEVEQEDFLGIYH